jgi:hypothetical protein
MGDILGYRPSRPQNDRSLDAIRRTRQGGALPSTECVQ